MKHPSALVGPPSRCVGENAVGKRGPDPDQSDGRKRVGGVFRPSEHRQSHLGYRRVTEFVQKLSPVADMWPGGVVRQAHCRRKPRSGARWSSSPVSGRSDPSSAPKFHNGRSVGHVAALHHLFWPHVGVRAARGFALRRVL